MYVNSASSIPLRQSTKKFFVLFFLCCSLPFIAAKLALQFSWFTAGATNKGQWLEQGVQLFPVTNSQQHWHLVYVQARECKSYCELALYTLQQIYTGFGRQQEQINPVILAEQAPKQLSNFPLVRWQTASLQLPELQDHIVIANQKGVAILRYPVLRDREHMLIVGKDIRSDLRRLMAYDRGGI
jgi:hypothetical protein